MINHEHMRHGFDKFHLNRDGEEPFQSRPVIHMIGEPDVDFHDHPAGFWVFLMRGAYEEEVLYDFGNGPVTTVVKHETFDRWFVTALTRHRITKIIEGPAETATLWQPSHRQPRFYRVEDGKIWSRQWDEAEFKLDQS